MTDSQQTFLILGGTGKTGRRVARRLAARGLAVRIGSRSGAPAFDWSEPDGWARALTGVHAVYITYQPDLAAPGAAGRVARFARLAVAGGVRRLVLLSGRGEPGVLPAEQAVRECGAEYTVLRAAWFSQNFSEGHLADGIRAGELVFPGGDVGEPFVDLEDLAELAVAALTGDAHVGATYELTGPRLLRFADAVAEIASASGRPLRYVPVSSEAYAAALAPYLPADELAFMVELFARVLDGHNAHLGDDLRRALGREPRDFSSYAREAAAAGEFV